MRSFPVVLFIFIIVASLVVSEIPPECKGRKPKVVNNPLVLFGRVFIPVLYFSENLLVVMFPN